MRVIPALPFVGSGDWHAAAPFGTLARTSSGALTLHKNRGPWEKKLEQKPEIWTTLKVLTWTKGYLAGKGIENARLEAEWLLCEALGLDRVGLYLNFDKPLTEEELAAYRSMVARRAKREPLQYILGSQEFMRA